MSLLTALGPSTRVVVAALGAGRRQPGRCRTRGRSGARDPRERGPGEPWTRVGLRAGGAAGAALRGRRRLPAALRLRHARAHLPQHASHLARRRGADAARLLPAWSAGGERAGSGGRDHRAPRGRGARAHPRAQPTRGGAGPLGPRARRTPREPPDPAGAPQAAAQGPGSGGGAHGVERQGRRRLGGGGRPARMEVDRPASQRRHERQPGQVPPGAPGPGSGSTAAATTS